MENELNRQRGKKEPKFGSKLQVATGSIDGFISVVNEMKHNFSTDKRNRIEESLKVINNYRKDFCDEHVLLNQAIEFILQNTQQIIAVVSEERQEKEYNI